MAIREFTDSRGVAWRVWCTTPEADSPLAQYFPGGWLTFDSGTTILRRLSPAPPNWETVSEERLQLMCRVAQEVPRHTGEMLKLQRPDPSELAGDDGGAPPSGSTPEGEERHGG